MYVELVIGNCDFILVECELDRFLHIIKYVPIIVGMTPDEAGNIHRACRLSAHSDYRLGFGQDKLVFTHRLGYNFLCFGDIGVVGYAENKVYPALALGIIVDYVAAGYM